MKLVLMIALSLLSSPSSIVVAAPDSSDVTEIASFSIPDTPSGMFFDQENSSLLYVLCGTQTNGNHYLYTFTTDGDQQCKITIPESVGMSRVDGFYIVADKAYIVDSQGPIYANDSGRLGGSVYEVEWNDPCGCDDGNCDATTTSWSPTVTDQWSLSASDVGNAEGGGNDAYFRNSGIVISDGSFYGVNGVHPIGGSYTNSYTKSIAKVNMDTSAVVDSWGFDATTIGRAVDMEGLTCGPDSCASSLYIGDEYNFIYKLDLDSGEVTHEWDLRTIVTEDIRDKGVEALTYASTTGYFYAGIQGTSEVHVLQLSGITPSQTNSPTKSASPSASPTTSAPTGSPSLLPSASPTLSSAPSVSSAPTSSPTVTPPGLIVRMFRFLIGIFTGILDFFIFWN